ncbi:MAG: hypothetical protein KAT40_08625, partial [Bacteroidales bacterium]|nr:hypothetical protein [Bacteroidales bacterium]
GIGNDDVVDYCQKENIDVIAKIPNSRRIAELYSCGELIYQKIPEVKHQFENIERYIFAINKKGA